MLRPDVQTLNPRHTSTALHSQSFLIWSLRQGSHAAGLSAGDAPPMTHAFGLLVQRRLPALPSFQMPIQALPEARVDMLYVGPQCLSTEQLGAFQTFHRAMVAPAYAGNPCKPFQSGCKECNPGRQAHACMKCVAGCTAEESFLHEVMHQCLAQWHTTRVDKAGCSRVQTAFQPCMRGFVCNDHT